MDDAARFLRSFFPSFLTLKTKQPISPATAHPASSTTHQHSLFIPGGCFYLHYIMQAEEGSWHSGAAVKRKMGGNGVRKPRRKIVNSDSSSTQRELYLPELTEYRKLNLAMEQRRVTNGPWSLDESRAYLAFLKKHSRDFETEQSRRRSEVFNKLSKVLHKRTPDQCRSHHQKLQNKFNNDINRIIASVQAKITRKEEAQNPDTQKIDKEMRVITTQDASQASDQEDAIIINFQEIGFW